MPHSSSLPPGAQPPGAQSGAALPSDALPSDALPSDALPSDALLPGAQPGVGQPLDGQRRDGQFFGGPPFDGQSLDGQSLDGQSLDGQSLDGQSLDGQSRGTVQGQPRSAGAAMEMVLAGLGWLASADMASAPVAVQADCLRGLERALAVHTAARAKALAAFTAQAGYAEDGQGSPRTWLTWQTRITRPAAQAAIGSMRRLAAHPAVAEALGAAAISASWARQICEWSDLLPAESRADADAILLAATAGGAGLADLAELAEEMRRRLAGPDRDGDGFDERSVRLATTLGGAGKLYGDLTPRCAAALRAVLDTLGKKAGPEDSRTWQQREHDALEEACRRLIASGCLPDRAGQPVQIQLHIGLDELIRRISGAGSAPCAEAGPGGPTLPWPAAAPGDECDASIAPVVTGRVDHDLLDRLATRLCGPNGPACPQCSGSGSAGDGAAYRNWAAARRLILENAVALLSGPDGLASWLRTGILPRPAASVSLPLDVGTVTDTIPPHLRRAVILRDKHCAAPGCDQPPAACHIHHVRPRSQGGTTRLSNLILLCAFHHLILVHRWGWTIVLNADGTTTATSPNGAHILHSHGPPQAAAA